MYQPKTGVRCGCKPGVYRANCPNCEGTGWIIDFKAIRKKTTEVLGIAVIRNIREQRGFVELIARMETESEIYERNGEGMSGDDAVDTLSELIASARILVAKAKGDSK